MDAVHDNSVLLRAVGKLLSAGGTLSLQEQLGAIGLLAAQSEMAEASRLRAAHLRKYSYTPMSLADVWGEKPVTVGKVPLLRREYIEPKKYDGAALRQLRAERGVGKLKPMDSQPRIKLRMPWDNSKERIIAYTLVKADNGDVSHFEGIRIFRQTSRVRRDRSMENAITDGQWISLVRHLTERVFS